MNTIGKQLRNARRSDVSAAASASAARLAEGAAGSGLLDVAYSTIDLPVGSALVAATPRGLCRVSYLTLGSEDAVLEDLAKRISPRVLEAPSYFDGLRKELDEYFAGERTEFDIPLDWSLTGGFARKILQKTARIPYGQTSTYKQMATAAGSPRAARAAGNALGSNPIPIVVPCHRVLHADGGIGGYTGGLDVKERLLQVEGTLEK